MKRLYIFFSICFWSISLSAVFAQGALSFHPNDTVIAYFAPTGSIEIPLYLINESSDSLTIKWNKLVNTLPSGWDYSICDLGTCYIGIPFTGTMARIGASDTAYLKLTIFPMDALGEGEVIIRLEPRPGEYDTVVFILSTYPQNISESSESSIYSLFPNPSSDYFIIESKKNDELEVRITDILGKTVRSERFISNRGVCNISDLPEGIYFASIYMQGRITETRKIIISR